MQEMAPMGGDGTVTIWRRKGKPGPCKKRGRDGGGTVTIRKRKAEAIRAIGNTMKFFETWGGNIIGIKQIIKSSGSEAIGIIFILDDRGTNAIGSTRFDTLAAKAIRSFIFIKDSGFQTI